MLKNIDMNEMELLIKSALKRYCLDSDEYEEVYSRLVVVYLNAVKTYKEGFNTKFSTYAFRCLENHLKNYFILKKNKPLISLDTPATEDGIETLLDTLEDTTISLTAKLFKLEREILIDKLLNVLEPIEKEIVTDYYLKEKTQKEIAERFHYGQSTINDKLKKAILKLRIELNTTPKEDVL